MNPSLVLYSVNHSRDLKVGFGAARIRRISPPWPCADRGARQPEALRAGVAVALELTSKIVRL